MSAESPDIAIQAALDSGGEVPLLPDEYEANYTLIPYDDAVQVAYDVAHKGTEKAIFEGFIDALVMPKAIDAYAEEAFDLEPAYARMAEQGVQPAMVFVPPFTLGEWTVVLQRHPVPFEVLRGGGRAVLNRAYLLDTEEVFTDETQGLKSQWVFSSDMLRREEDKAVPKRDEPASNDWQLAVIGSRNQPSEEGEISADASIGWERIKRLGASLGLVDTIRVEESVKAMSPRPGVYYAQQWSRLLRGIIPVDVATKSFLKVPGLGYEWMNMAFWDAPDARVFTAFTPSKESKKGLGLRLAISSDDLHQYDFGR
jgi:hypothetical protein